MEKSTSIKMYCQQCSSINRLPWIGWDCKPNKRTSTVLTTVCHQSSCIMSVRGVWFLIRGLMHSILSTQGSSQWKQWITGSFPCCPYNPPDYSFTTELKVKPGQGPLPPHTVTHTLTLALFYSLLVSCETEVLAQMFPDGRRWSLFPMRSLCWWCSDGFDGLLSFIPPLLSVCHYGATGSSHWLCSFGSS